MIFLHPLVLLLALPVWALLLLGVMGYVRRRRQLGAAFGGPAASERLTGLDLGLFPRLRVGTLAAATAMLVGAAAEPQWRSELSTAPDQPLDLVLALDVSRSMQASDADPSRLAAARELARRVVEGLLPSDRVGLVLFASRAYTLAPITTDHAVTEFFLRAVDPELVSPKDEGTAISAAVLRGTELLLERPAAKSARVLLLLGDGESHDDEAKLMQVVEDARSAGVRTFAVGVGTESGAMIGGAGEAAGQATQAEPSDAGPVLSRLNAPLLRRIAQTGRGSYASSGAVGGVERFLAAFRRRAPEEGESDVASAMALGLRFWFGVAALLLLVGESAIERRAGRRRPLRGERR